MPFLIWKYFLSGFYFDMFPAIDFRAISGLPPELLPGSSWCRQTLKKTKSSELSESIYFYLKTLYRHYIATASP